MDFEGTENDLRQAVLGLSQSSCDWYGLGLAFSKEIDNQQIVEVAKDIEGFSPSRTLWVTTREVGAIQENSDNNLAYLLNKAKLSRTWCQYSSSNPYAAISAFARIATVDYTGENTTLTLKFKNEPTIESETLTSSQYKVLASRKCNVFVLLQNGESIIQEGYMSDGTCFIILIYKVLFAISLHHQQLSDWEICYCFPVHSQIRGIIRMRRIYLNRDFLKMKIT